MCLHCIMRHLRDTWNSVWMPCFTMKCIANFGCLRCISQLSIELFHDKVYTCVSACGIHVYYDCDPLLIMYYLYQLLFIVLELDNIPGVQVAVDHWGVFTGKLYSLVIVFLNHHGEDAQYKNVRVILQMYLQNTPPKETALNVPK